MKHYLCEVLTKATKLNAKCTELVDQGTLQWDPDSYLIKVVILYVHCGSADNL
jgi:hypothetical protein